MRLLVVKNELENDGAVENLASNCDVRLMRIDLFMKYDGFLKVSITAKLESGTYATAIWRTV